MSLQYTKARKSLPSLFLFIISFIQILSDCGCNRNPISFNENKRTSEQDGKWVSDIPFIVNDEESLPHDNRIFESENILVFSDGSSDEVKRRYSGFAEQAFKELKWAFGIGSSAALGISSQNQRSKITIYSNRYSDYRQMAFAYGFILFALDHQYTLNNPRFEEYYPKMVKHEMMHVIQFFLINNEPINTWTHFWFTEGIAEYVSDDLPIQNISQVNEWLMSEDHINPISIHYYEDFPAAIRNRQQLGDWPVAASRIGEYYPMFGLAVQYLLDERGHGRTLSDVKRMFGLMKFGTPFQSAFGQCMKMSVEDFEEIFFDLITDYLSNADSNRLPLSMVVDDKITMKIVK